MWHKGIILLLAAFLTCGALSATQYAYVVSFADKNGTTYTLSSPSAYLTSRAITRRTSQSIATDSLDLPVNEAYIDSVMTLTGGKLHGVSRWKNLCIVLLNDSTHIHTLDGKSFIKGTKLVGYYADSLHRPTVPPPAPGDRAFKTTAGDATYYGNTWNQTLLVNGNLLHDAGYTGSGKLIAFIDAGFPDVNTHPGFADLISSGRLVDKFNFTLRDSYVFSYDPHGMHAFSTMAGYVPNTFVGSAPMASYALYISEDGLSEQPIELYNMLFATERADSMGADVVSSSLGYNTFDNPADNFVFAADLDGKTTVAAQAANIATSKGMLFVASAGNEGGGGWNMVLTPGDADSALTIGSVNNSGAMAPNSGYGPNAAGQIKPDVCGMGQAAAILLGSSGYGNQSGTSFSTPQIAGWAACLWQAFPSATPYQIRQAIIRCANSYSSPGNQNGYGIPDFDCSRHMMLAVDTPPPAPALWMCPSPNPFSGDLVLTVYPDTDQTVTFALYDISGRLIYQSESSFKKGKKSQYSIPAHGIAAGIYTLKAVCTHQHQVMRLQKL